MSRPPAIIRIAPRRGWPILLALVCLASCRSPGPDAIEDGGPIVRHTAARAALGTTYRLTIYAPDAKTAAAASAAAFDRLEEVDAALNTDRPDSEVSALNAAGEGVAVKVSDDLFTVLQHALRLAGATRGAFDVTAGPYGELWRRTAAAGRAPSAPELEAARLRVGWDKLRLNAIERSAALTVPGMRLDTAGIARGYAADEVFRQLRRHGCEQSRVDAGNVVVAGEAPPGQHGWPVVMHGTGGSGGPRSIPLTRTAIAFSPNIPIGRKDDPAARPAGVPRLINPINGRAVADRATAAVLARSGATAESIAAAAAVLGPAGAELLAAAEGAARIHFGAPPATATPPRRRRR